MRQTVTLLRDDDSCSQTELKKLAEMYAIRVRQLSDAVAILGRRITAGHPIETSVMKVKRLQSLAEKASEELMSALESADSGNSAA
jgi:hypothetical protein